MRLPRAGKAVRRGDRGKAATFQDRFGRLHRCDSKTEAKRGAILDRAGFIVSREGVIVPYVFNGRNCRYYPDWIVKHGNGTIAWIEEDKPLARVNDPQNQAKFAAARAWCARHGYRFRVITEREMARP